MKTLLRHTRNGLYFKGPERWTEDPDQALDFRFVDRAISYISTWELKNVELALAYEDSQGIELVTLQKTTFEYAAA